MEPWEREHLAGAIDEAAMSALDDLLRQRVDQAGGRIARHAADLSDDEMQEILDAKVPHSENDE